MRCLRGMGTDLYRLRLEGKVVGYRKQVGRYEFFSRDDFWYNGTALEYDTEEAFTGLKDRRGRKLFVGDVVRSLIDGQERVLRVTSMDNGVPALCCHRSEAPVVPANILSLLADSYHVSLA